MKLLNLISYLTLGSAFFLVAMVGFWLLCPYEPITFESPHRVLTTEVKRGDHLSYEVVYCKNNNLTPTITKTFVDGIIYNVPEIVSTKNEMGCNTNIIQMYIPRGLPAGEFYVETIYRYKVNPIRTVDVVTQTERFTIR